MRLFRPAGAPSWLAPVVQSVERAFREPMDAPFRLKAFAKSDLPADPRHRAGLVYVTDEAGGPVPAFHDGSDWRRVTDRAIVS